jgi:PAS domain S-box-containing protein
MLSLNSYEGQIFLQGILNAFQTSYILFDPNKRIMSMFLADSLSSEVNIDNAQFQSFVDDIITHRESKKEYLHSDKKNIFIHGIPISSAHHLFGILIIFPNHKDPLDIEYENMAIDLKTIFESTYNVIFVTDGNGVALRANTACEKLWGIKKSDFIGRSMMDLEKEGFFHPSATRLVLESKKKVSIIQKTHTGKTLLVVGTPVMDETGKIIRIINASRDITEIDQLKRDLQESKEISERYQREIQRLRLSDLKSNNKVIYRSQVMERLIELAKKIAEFDSTVLITGESGVGKEVLASLIHESSPRFEKPFVKINCGAIPETLLESELFGYEKGAFSGASKDGKMGLFQTADQGTIFLDEIGEMPLPLQVKLLRVLQEREILPIGGTSPIKVDNRIIAATNKNIENLIQQGKFREDLYYRLNVIPLEIPPLRNRKDDIPILVDFFTKNFNTKYGTHKKFSLEAVQQMQKYEWKGNVRELQNCVERLIVTLNHDEVKIEDVITLLSFNPIDTILPFGNQYDSDLKETLSLIEKNVLETAVKRHKTTVQIAKVLNLTQSAVSKKLKKYNIPLK